MPLESHASEYDNDNASQEAVPANRPNALSRSREQQEKKLMLPAGEAHAWARILREVLGVSSSLLPKTIIEEPETPLVVGPEGKYHILEQIGGGGFGRVFHARGKNFRQDVAIKVSRHLHDEEMQWRAQNEGRKAHKLGRGISPYFLQVDDQWDIPEDWWKTNDETLKARYAKETGKYGAHFIVMEYFPHPTLEKVLKKGPLPLPTALEITRQTADGLHTAHGLNLVHRDIKPENLLVKGAESGEITDILVKIIDLGMAVDLDEVAQLNFDERKTHGSSLLGTSHFMAPEQARNPKNVSGKADIYSLAWMLFMMIRGFHPYNEMEPELARAEHRNKNKPPLVSSDIRQIYPSIAADLEALWISMVKVNPSERLSAQEVRDFVVMLQQKLQHLDGKN